MQMNGDIYCAVRREYDETGNVILEKYYDGDGNPTFCRDGYAMITREYNSLNRIVCERFFGTDGNPMELEDGAAVYRYEYLQDDGPANVVKYDLQDRILEEEAQG